MVPRNNRKMCAYECGRQPFSKKYDRYCGTQLFLNKYNKSIVHDNNNSEVLLRQNDYAQLST